MGLSSGKEEIGFGLRRDALHFGVHFGVERGRNTAYGASRHYKTLGPRPATFKAPCCHYFIGQI